jgi:hypothetical protein
MFGAPLIAVFIIYGRSALGNIDWRLVRTTGWLYAAALTIYGVVHFIRAAWKCDVARQGEILQKDEVITKKDQEYREAIAQSAERCRNAMSVIQKECDTFERSLNDYRVVWRDIQVRTRALVIDMREFCELKGPAPTPPLIAGEDPAEFRQRRVPLVDEWLRRLMYEFDQRFSDQVKGLRDEFVAIGHDDFVLDRLISTGINDTQQIREIADRLIGLALKELAQRQLRTLTLKQLCCD